MKLNEANSSESKYSSEIHVSDNGKKYTTYRNKKAKKQAKDQYIFVANTGELGNWLEGVE